MDALEACPLDQAQLDPPTGEEPPPGVGRVIGSYRLVCLLGEGGMGNIYVGAHTRLNRFAAIKLLKPELQNRHDAIARFFEEARTVNRIKHPNIVESIDLVEDVADGAYCVLELLHGPSLKRRLLDGRLPPDSAIRVGAQIADALHAVHALDIVHRDLKPDNLILIDRGGRSDYVKLIDFGVAQMGNDDASGMPFGTAAYMAPEQAAGERVDGRADVYSLGVLLFEMVTGIHPFPSTNDNEYVLRHADDTPPRPSKVLLEEQIPRELDAVILRCLEKRPKDRYPSAAAVAIALRAIDVTPRKRRTGLVIALGALAGAGIGAALIVPELLAKEPREAVAAPVEAPAPVPAPMPKPDEPAPAPAQPETVTLKFVSTPSGAKVFRKGESVALGVTPFETTLVRASRTAAVHFELDGYEPMEVDASLAKSENISVTLDKLAPTPVALDKPRTRDKPAKTGKKPLQREGVMDPFATKN
ncbi:MAG: serine/threonine protein kinase [Myxococcota bacterium]|nr:serine/threonine protein kinase [Myxococcota bacterium]